MSVGHNFTNMCPELYNTIYKDLQLAATNRSTIANQVMEFLSQFSTYREDDFIAKAEELLLPILPRHTVNQIINLKTLTYEQCKLLIPEFEVKNKTKFEENLLQLREIYDGEAASQENEMEISTDDGGESFL